MRIKSKLTKREQNRNTETPRNYFKQHDQAAVLQATGFTLATDSHKASFLLPTFKKPSSPFGGAEIKTSSYSDPVQLTTCTTFPTSRETVLKQGKRLDPDVVPV